MKPAREIVPPVMEGIARRRANPEPDAPDGFHEHQAAAFIAFRRKNPARDWEDLLLYWGSTKDLALSDLWAIRRIVRDELVARGEAVFTDPIPDVTESEAA